MSLASQKIRLSFGAADALRDRGLTTPADIRRCDNISYGPDPKMQLLDVYRPMASSGKLPVIVNVHGGGWVYGDKEVYQFYCMSLAQRGFAVVNFTYRLAPESTFPASLEDTNTVFTWLLTHSEEYGFDTEHVFAVGDSAGAHLLSLYCSLCTNPDYAKNFSFAPPKGFAPTAVCLNCGKYDLSALASGEQDALIQDLMGGKLTPDNVALINAAGLVTDAYPPAYIMTCTGDFLAPQAPVMSAVLMEKGVPHELHYYSDGKKPLGHVFHCNMRLDAATRCNDEECAWFKSFC